jgi:hypothetical protein
VGDKEIEGFGVSYDRLMICELQEILTKKYMINSVLEMPSFGAKAAPSIYSLGFAKMGVDVTVVNFDEQMKKYWEYLDLAGRLNVISVDDYCRTDFEDNSFDLIWNFVTFSYLENTDSLLGEMFRVTGKYILIVSCNNFQLGYPWHKVLHKLYGIKWNHGDTYYNYPWNLKKSLLKRGFRIKEYGTIDSPPWPDPVGFRDIRLHKKKMETTVNSDEEKTQWEVPFIEYFRHEKYPLWMRILKLYDLALHRYYFKLPFSHLYYVFGVKAPNL